MSASLPLHKKLFYILLFLLPLNLGKHFIFNFSYVNGILVDYLIPTIFIQDILIVCISFFWKFNAKTKFLPIIAFLIFSLFLSLLLSTHFHPALYGFSHYLLYVLFFLYVLSEFNFATDLKISLQLLIYSGAFVAVLGIIQAILQHSVFNNFLFFGEQPYNFATYGITKKLLFDQTFIPPYALFRHPNIFAGYISIIFFFSLFYARRFNKKYLLFSLLFLVALFLTLSKSAIAATFISLVLLAIYQFKPQFLKPTYLLVACTAVLFGLFFTFKSQDPSVYRRTSLVYTAYTIIANHPLYGVGLNNFFFYNRIAFMQPVHNIFLLGFGEQGIIAFSFFLLLIFLAIKNLFKNIDLLGVTLLVCLLQVVFIGSFDHYFITIHQTFLLFLLTLAISLTYNSNK